MDADAHVYFGKFPYCRSYKTDGWEEYHELLEPKMAGDVLILPGYALAASYNTYEEEDQHRVGPSLVIHHYAGTWKNDYGGQVA